MLIAITSDFWINTENIEAMRVYADGDSKGHRIVFYLSSGHEVSSPPLSPDVVREVIEALIDACGVTRITDLMNHRKGKLLRGVLDEGSSKAP